MDYVSSLTAFKLNCRGPAMTIGSACSSSSVAVALACDSLRAGRCDTAIAGGVSIRFPAYNGYVFTEGYILSHDGRCRPFDENASGTVMADGVGVIILKRLCNAVADGDDILAVIKGYAVLNDGSEKATFNSPSVQGQTRTMHDALSDAGISADSISYVETHGTGTTVGDAIEFQAISEILGSQSDELCHIGAIKGNIGHTNSASGVFGLIKLLLCLRNKKIPPLANFTKNPSLSAHGTRLRFPLNAMCWKVSGEHTKRAGLALSTGFGGTNAAFVLEEFDQSQEHHHPQSTEEGDEAVILPLSAASIAALSLERIQLAEHLENEPKICLQDVALTLRNGRRALPFRQAFIVKSVGDAAARLRKPDNWIPNRADHRPSLLFVFPGQGFRCVGLGAGLYEGCAVFRQAFEDCLEILDQYHISEAVRQILLQKGEISEKYAEGGTDGYPLLHVTQPSLFVLEYSIARLLCTAFGAPDGVLGYSFGEIVAACISGASSLQSALSFVVARERLMDRLPKGGMLSVRMSKSSCCLLASELGLCVAAEHGPDSFVLSGNVSAISKARMKLQDMGIAVRHLDVTHAFHSKMMDSVLDELLEAITPYASTFRPPTIPFFSTVTGKQWEVGSPIPAVHWVEHIRNPVLFAGAMQIASQELPQVLAVEIGPKVLSTLIQQLSYVNNKRVVVVDIFSCQGTSVHEKLLVAAGKIWESGHDVVLKRCYTSLPSSPGHAARRIKLPTYPFERVPCVFRPPTHGNPQDPSFQINEPYIDELTGKSGLSGTAMDLSALVALERWDQTDIVDPVIDLSATNIPNVLESDLVSTERLQSLVEQARRCANMQPFLNARALKHIYNTLQHLQLENTEFSSDNYAQAFTKAGVLDKHSRFCKRLIQLSTRSVVAQDGDMDAPFDHTILEHDIIEGCGNELTAILRGSTSAHDILFPSLEDHYRYYPFHALSNYLAASSVRHFIQTNPPLRVLEVGAGTASFTSELLSHALPESFEVYLFTDISRAFFADAQRQFSIFPTFRTKVFDLEVHPALQGFTAGSFDVVIGSNCVHAVKDVSKALRHLNWLTRPGGLLTLIEVLEPEIWQEFVFGTLPGWWNFDDMLVRQTSLLLGWKAWKEALECAGFGNTHLQPAVPIHRPGQSIKEGVITANKTIQSLGLDTLKEVSINWCQILLDDHSLSRALSTVLLHHDVHHIIQRDINTGELKSALHVAQAAGRKCCIILGQITPGYDMLQDIDEENRRWMQRNTCLPLLNQLQKLAEIDAESLTALRILVMTRSAQCITQQNTQSLSGLQLLGSLVLGICRSAVQEIPSIELAAIDLDMGTDAKIDAVAVGREIFATHAEPEVAYRRLARFTRRIVSGARTHGLARNRIQDPGNPQNIRTDATYIVSGSSGGLGQLIVRDLLQRGAKYILLLSRSPERHRLAGLQLPQTSNVVCVDVGDFQQLSATIQKMRAIMPPFCTVFHAAGTLSDGTITNQTWEKFETVLRSKVDGTLNLLHLLADDNLDNFVLFSSIVGALGNAGQVNHAAACCFESSIARLLTSQGRSVMAIEWGPWRDIGAASSPTILARMLQRGLESISPAEGLAALRAVTYPAPVNMDSSHTASLIIARVDWNRLGNSFPTYARQTLFESTGLITPKSNVQDDIVTAEAISLLSPLAAEFESKTEQVVFQTVVDVLGLSYHELSLTIPLVQYGLDSLSIIMLVRHLNKKLAVHFRPQQFLTVSECTIKGLATLVDKQVTSIADSSKFDQELVILSRGVEDSMPFFLFHGAGGAVYMLQDLATSLSALTGRPAIAVWPPGLTDDNYETDIDSLASRYSKSILKYCSGPYDFIGYSLGGGIAAACASILYRDHRIHVQNLVLLDTPIPSAMRLGGLTTTDDVYRYLTELDPSLQIHHESFEKFAKLFLHHCRIYKIWEPSITAGINHIFFVKSQERNSEWEPVDPEANWIQLTTKSISTGVTPGNHSTMLGQSQGGILANLIRTNIRLQSIS